MTGSMYASVAGLKAHMQKLTVIGNNVANVNTQGYKKQRTVFRDSVYSLYSAGSNGTSSVGGMNPSQLGYGSRIGSIDLNMSSASYNPGNPMDCALVGDGFFLVGDKETANVTNPASYDDFSSESLKSLKLTRVGDFQFKADNYLTDGAGNVVYGFMCTGMHTDETGKDVPEISDQLVPIRLPRWEKVTTTSTGDDGTTTTSESYVIRYARTDIPYGANGPDTGTGGTPGTGTTTTANKLVDDKPIYHANDAGTGNGTNKVDPNAEYEFAQMDSISIDAGTGCITGISKADGRLITIGYLAIGSVDNPNGVSHIGDSYYQALAGAGNVHVSMLGGVHKDLGISQLNGSMATAGTGDGNTPPDPNAAIQYKSGTDILGSDTEMMVGFLEGPNVDLAEEISELITTQRGYQANTRIITVTDSMLEELVNMKR